MSREAGKAPAFQFYPKDFLTDENVRVMSFQERGVYITLICLCWLEGSLPADADRLARLSGTPLAAFRKVWPAIVPCFTPDAERPDRLVHPRLERERMIQSEYRRRQSEKGKASANRRATGQQPQVNRGLTMVQPTPVQPEGNSAIPDLRSSSPSPERVPARPSPDRVGRFVDRYRELHERYRGVPYLGNDQTNYREACTLVANFSDEMLDAITAHWLNVPEDKFTEDRTRTIAQLRSRASKYAEELKAKKLA